MGFVSAVAGEPGSHPINMADDHDNDHDSGLEDITLTRTRMLYLKILRNSMETKIHQIPGR